MADEPISAGEVARSLTQFREEIRDDVAATRGEVVALRGEVRDELRSVHKELQDSRHALRNQIAGLSFVSHAEFSAHMKALDERHEALEMRVSNLEGLKRLLWTSVLAPVVVSVVLFLLLRGSP